MKTFNYKERYTTAMTRRDRHAAAKSGEAGGGAVIVSGGNATGVSGGGGSGGNSSSPIIDAVTIQPGEGIRVEKNGNIFKILHGLTSDGESTANEDNDGFFIKNIEVDDFGHIKKITAKGMTESFDDRYLRKDQPDETEYNITFKDGLTIGAFVEGLLGSGAHIDKEGNGWMGGLHLRDFLEVPELRFNRVDVVSGEIWNSVAFGTIESVDTATQTVTLKLEEGELSGLHVNDICRGIFHNLTGNETANGVDSAGFDKLAGFSTSYFTPTQIIDNSHFKYSLKPGTTTHPCRAMKFAVYGNFTDTTRQSCAYQTRNYLRFLRGVNTWVIKQSHVSAQFGDLTGLQVDGQFLTQGSIYLNDVYFGGNILKVGGLQDKLKGADGKDGKDGAAGKDGYTVGLDKYAYMYKMATGSVPTQISFAAFAVRGTTALTYSNTPSAGKYSVNVKSKTGCTVTQSGNKITFASFIGDKEGVVVVTVNCEGVQSFDLTFTATKVADGAAGAAGKDGAAGNTVQQIYKRSATQPTTPATSVSPSGWSFTPPTGTAPLWMSKATFTGAGALSGSWSYPIKITGDTGPAGAAGKDGVNGSPICFRGTYDSAKNYYANASRADVVKVGTVYYKVSSTAGTVHNSYPPSNYSVKEDGTKPWVRLDSFEHVATGLLFAEEATIANWYFSNSRIESINRNVGLDGTADATTPRIWIGAKYEDRNTAPIRFYENKAVFGATTFDYYGNETFRTIIGQFSIDNKGLYAASDVIQGSVYGNPKGLWLQAAGTVRIVSSDGNKFGLFSCYQNMILDLRNEAAEDGNRKAGITISMSGGKKGDGSGLSPYKYPMDTFLSCSFSAGGSYRCFDVSARSNNAEAEWDRRIIIRASRMPFWDHIKNCLPTIANSGGNGTYTVKWDARSGAFYVQ